MTATFTSIATNVWNIMGPQKHIELALDKLTQDQLIQIADCVRDIFKNTDMLDPPTLCVVGSQSSGKSITLNGLTGIDILPNGKSIVTRTPIHLRLVHTKDSKIIYVDFYDSTDSQKLTSSFQIDALTTPNEQLVPIRDEIMRLTEIRAGKSKNVVDIPIDIRIRSPDVPNLSIIDLPGLTNIALTDMGQPENIKENIEQMLIKYIKNPRTIILAIVPATIDVESDMGLGLIKKYDPDFKRTIGVITKVDLLKDSNVEPYLNGNISRNLRLGYGYWAVRNRSSDEIKTMSVKDGHSMEQKFFNETDFYKNCLSKTGSINLGNRLSEILLAHLRDCLPTVMEEIKNEDRSIELQLDEIGRDYPVTESAKRSTLNILLHEFQRDYENAINSRGCGYNTGARIADSFKKFNTSIEKLDPFISQSITGSSQGLTQGQSNRSLFSDENIKTLIRDYNGIHMPDMMISTGVIEKCFQKMDINDKRIQPLQIIREPFTICIKEIQLILVELVDIILLRERFNRFPKLCARIKEIVTGHLIPGKFQLTNDKVDDFFEEETTCIWTDDNKFRYEILPTIANKSKNGEIDPQVIRNVLSGYFNVIKNIAMHSIHKKISTFFVSRVIDDINQMLEENKEKVVIRERLTKMKEKIEQAKSMIFNVH